MSISYYQSLSPAERTLYNAKNYQKARAKKVWPVTNCAECQFEYIKPEGYSYKFCTKDCKDNFTKRYYKDRLAERRRLINKVRAAGISFLSVYKKSNGACAGCGLATPLNLRGTSNLLAPEVDHILPVTCGGAHIEENLQILCKGCNVKKGNRMSLAEIESLSHLAVDSIDLKAIAIKNMNHPWSNNTSGYKGVTWNRLKQRWTARFYLPSGERFTVGSFADKHSAGAAVMKKRMEIYCNG